MAMPDPKFIKDGIQFECQGSGKCCTSRGAYGYVYLTSEDRKRFAKFFGVTVREFRRKFCDEEDGNVYLRNPDADCSFLDGKRCSVYEARPNQCRSWPFWPENLNAKAWNKEVASYCPGVGKGRVYTAFEIEAIVKTKT
jgi:Fe-S-cluster containining protein